MNYSQIGLTGSVKAIKTLTGQITTPPSGGKTPSGPVIETKQRGAFTANAVSVSAVTITINN